VKLAVAVSGLGSGLGAGGESYEPQGGVGYSNRSTSQPTPGLYLKAGVGSRVFLNPVADLVGHTYDTEFGDYRERLVHYGVGIVVPPGK
jgi:hypothetical protein